jgi:hypothetical protein
LVSEVICFYILSAFHMTSGGPVSSVGCFCGCFSLS